MVRTANRWRYPPRGRWRLTQTQYDDALLAWLIDRDPKAEEALLRNYWMFIWKRTHAFHRLMGGSLEDVFSMALEGAMEGIRAYKPAYFLIDSRLITFVANGIRWKILRDLPQERYRIKIPINNPVLVKLPQAMRELGLGHPLLSEGIAQLAIRLNVKPKMIEKVYLAMQARDVTQETPARQVSLGLDATIEDQLESEWPGAELFAARTQLQRKIARLLLTLTPREERVIRLRFGLNCDERTLDQVGDQYGVGKERIRQIEAKALRKMKHPFRSNQLFDAQMRQETLSRKDQKKDRDRYYGDQWWYDRKNYDAIGIMMGELPYQ